MGTILEKIGRMCTHCKDTFFNKSDCQSIREWGLCKYCRKIEHRNEEDI